MRYFIGSALDLGQVSQSPFTSFEELRKALLEPVELRLTRQDYLGITTKAARSKAKRVKYLVPAQFKSSPSPRKYESAAACNLIALDVDDAGQAKRLTEGHLAQLLGDFAFIAWHTASSTHAAPRVRVLVSAEAIPIQSYPSAVRTVAALLGIDEPTTESRVAVQPMFWPTTFQGDVLDPVFAVGGTEPFTLSDCASISQDAPAAASAPQADDEDGPVKDISFLRSPMEAVTPADVEDALSHLDPDCPMAQWIEIAAGVKHQFDSDEGYQLWDKWSAKGTKYPGDEETAYRWGTLKANPEGRSPVTLRSVFRLAQARGWVNSTLAGKAHAGVLDWLRSPSRSAEELLDQGCQRIAKVGVTVGILERKTLMNALKSRLDEMRMPLALPDIRRRVRQIEVEEVKTSGIPPWAKGLCFVTSANQFYRHTTDRRFAPEVIDLVYSSPQIGDEKPMRPRDFLIQVAGVPQVENLRYDPKQGTKRFFTEFDRPFVNTYRSGSPAPTPETADEAGAIFLEHIGHLIKEPEYGRTLIDFLAFHVQKPGHKVRWAVVVQGAQGCGKSFIGAAMQAMLGRRNVRKLTASDVMEGNHNGWAYGQQLIVLEEVRIAGANRYAVMDKLKPCISDDDISIRRLYEAHQTVPNCCNYLMFTNHHDSLAVHDDDRRYFVLASPLQSAAQIAGLGGQSYFDRLFRVLRDDAGGLRAWFESWEISPSFNPDGRAPVTQYLKELADAAASPLMASVRAAIEDEAHALVRSDLLSLTSLRQCLGSENLKAFSDQALASVLRELGWTKHGRVLVGDGRHALWYRGKMKDPAATARERDEVL